MNGALVGCSFTLAAMSWRHRLNIGMMSYNSRVHGTCEHGGYVNKGRKDGPVIRALFILSSQIVISRFAYLECVRPGGALDRTSIRL